MKRVFRRIAVCLLAGYLLLACAGCAEKERPNMDKILLPYQLMDGDISVKAYGATGDGQTSDTQAVADACQAAEEHGKRLFFPAGQYQLSAAQITFPQQVNVVFEQGAVLLLDAWSKLAFNGPISAGDYQIFSGDIRIQIRSSAAGNPMWFGAKGDGVTDDTEAFKTAWKVFNQLDVPYTEAGYVITSIDTFKNMALRGSSHEKTILVASPRTYKLFNVIGGDLSVSHIEFRMAAAPKYSSAFYFDTATSYIENVYITDCDFYDAYNAFTDARAENVMMFMHFEDINCYDARCSTFDIQDFEGFVFMKRMYIDNSNSYAKHGVEPFAAFLIDDVRGDNFEDITVIGANTGSEKEIGFHVPGAVAMMSALSWKRVTIRNMGGYGIVFGQVILSEIVDSQILHCGGGVCAEGLLEVQIDNLTVDGNQDSSLGLDGIFFNNTVYSHLTNVVSKNNGGNGLRLNNSNYNLVKDSEFSNNADRGVLLSGGKCNGLFSSTCLDNANGQVSLFAAESLVDQVVYRADGTVGSITDVGRFD
ncbi:MAG: right-handed parallel beta-helix repeat-containing protein [Clostridia bacterium]|nr:right-handed parallel beta-helix repeat-containing protein [Clostridia bacterium]